MRFLLFRILGRRIRAIPRMMRDKSVSIFKKLLIIGGLIYLFSPISLIPIVLFPVAWVDGFILWVFILWYLKDELDKYWLGEKPQDLSKEFRGKTVIRNVRYEVKDDEGKK